MEKISALIVLGILKKRTNLTLVSIINVISAEAKSVADILNRINNCTNEITCFIKNTGIKKE